MSVIRILHPLEIKEYETPPLFDSFNRKKFLTLPAALVSLSDASRHPLSKIALVVQCGYFRACHRFFGSQFRADDLAFVAARLNLPRPEILELSKQTLLRQREAIAECFGACQFQPTERQTLGDEIAGKPGSIITWKHINFHGEYDFSDEKMQDSVGLNLPKILAWKAE